MNEDTIHYEHNFIDKFVHYLLRFHHDASRNATILLGSCLCRPIFLDDSSTLRVAPTRARRGTVSVEPCTHSKAFEFESQSARPKHTMRTRASSRKAPESIEDVPGCTLTVRVEIINAMRELLRLDDAAKADSVACLPTGRRALSRFKSQGEMQTTNVGHPRRSGTKGGHRERSRRRTQGLLGREAESHERETIHL